MSETTETVDTNTIEELGKLKERVDVLQGRLEAMEARRESVSDAVFERVQGDYRSQLEALAEEAAPLKAKGRAEYASLKENFEQLQSSYAEARLAKEEVDFRNDLGEFTAKEYGSLTKEHETTLANCEEELNTVQALRQTFIDAFGSEEDLEGATESTEEVEQLAGEDTPSEDETMGTVAVTPEDPTANSSRGDEGEEGQQPDPEPELQVEENLAQSTDVSPVVDDTAPEQQAEDEAEDEASEADDTEEESEEESEEEAEPEGLAEEKEPDEKPDDENEDDDEDEDEDEGPEEEEDWSTASTNIFSTPMVPSGENPPPFEPAPEEAPPNMATDATRILSKPRLVSLEGGEPTSTYMLGATVVTLGRSAENSIRLTEEAVSRRHAEVIPGPDGYLLRDMGSENGSYVNGKRKKEHLLVEGDIVQIGVRKLRFHDS